MVTWSDILVALGVYPRPTNASTQCCCAFLSIVINGFRMFVVFTIDLFAYHGSLASDFRLSLVVWVGGVVVPPSSLMKKHEGTGQDLEVKTPPRPILWGAPLVSGLLEVYNLLSLSKIFFSRLLRSYNFVIVLFSVFWIDPEWRLWVLNSLCLIIDIELSTKISPPRWPWSRPDAVSGLQYTPHKSSRSVAGRPVRGEYVCQLLVLWL